MPSSHLQLAVQVWLFQFRQRPDQSVKADVYVKEYDWDVGNQNPVYSELSQQPSVTLLQIVGTSLGKNPLLWFISLQVPFHYISNEWIQNSFAGIIEL